MFKKRSSAKSSRVEISGPLNVSKNGSSMGPKPTSLPSPNVDALISSPIDIYPTTTDASVNSVGSGSIQSSSNFTTSALRQQPSQQNNLRSYSATNSANGSQPHSQQQARLSTVSSASSNSVNRLLPSPSISSLSSSASYLSNFSNQKVIDYVQAVFAFSSDKKHSLSFNAGEIIRVLLKLESGWWDGVNPQGQRGWFPSNYTTPALLGSVPTDITTDSNELSMAASASVPSSPLQPCPERPSAVPSQQRSTATISTNSATSQRGTPENAEPTASSFLFFETEFNPATTEYKFMDISDDYLKSNPEIQSVQWAVSNTRMGKFYYCHALKAYASSLPFEPQQPSNVLTSINEHPAAQPEDPCSDLVRMPLSSYFLLMTLII